MINSLLAAWVNGYINTEEMVPRQSDTAIWKDIEMQRYMEKGRHTGMIVRTVLNGSEKKPCWITALTKASSMCLRRNRMCSEQSHTSLQILAI